MQMIELALSAATTVAATSRCPVCGQHNEIRWDLDGTLQWWPQPEHCRHYRGCYQTGAVAAVMAAYAPKGAV